MSSCEPNGRSLHAILGGGPVADILLWRNVQVSAMLVGVVVLTWFLFHVLDYSFVTLVCHICMPTMLAFFAWSTGAKYFSNRWSPPNIHSFTLPESTFRPLLGVFNKMVLNFCDISRGENLKNFCAVFVSLWVLSITGNYISSLNIFCIVLLALLVGPVMYELFGNY